MKKYSALKESVTNKKLELSFDFEIGENESMNDYLKKAVRKSLEIIHHEFMEEIFRTLSEYGVETDDMFKTPDYSILVFHKKYRYGLSVWTNWTDLSSGNAYSFYLNSYNLEDPIEAKTLYNTSVEALDGLESVRKNISLKELMAYIKHHEMYGKF
jgi:hypothetical protein